MHQRRRDRVPLILDGGPHADHREGQVRQPQPLIHWAQEMFDQAGMLREFVKWDYELRDPEQVGDVVSRASKWR